MKEPQKVMPRQVQHSCLRTRDGRKPMLSPMVLTYCCPQHVPVGPSPSLQVISSWVCKMSRLSSVDKSLTCQSGPLPGPRALHGRTDAEGVLVTSMGHLHDHDCRVTAAVSSRYQKLRPQTELELHLQACISIPFCICRVITFRRPLMHRMPSEC